MGLIESNPGGVPLPPSPNNEKPFRGEIKTTIRNLFVNGGAISSHGQILASTLSDLKLERLCQEDAEKLKTDGTLRLAPWKARPILPEGSTVKMVCAYLIHPGINQRLRFASFFNSYRIYLKREGNTGYSELNDVNRPNLGFALRNLIKERLHDESVQIPSVAKFLNELLKELSQEKNGLGKIEGSLFRSYTGRRHLKSTA